MIKVLVVEDDVNLRKLMAIYLTKNGFDVTEATDGAAAYAYFLSHHVDVLVTDVMMPVMDGNVLISKVRALNRDVPIMILTALDSYADKENGFLNGADDYMVKPIDPKEMVLRIHALARRYQIIRANQLSLPHLFLDAETLQCLVIQKPVELTTKEFQLLFKLLSSPNKIFTREQLMNDIWGFDSESYDRTVDTHIKRLRERVPADDFDIVTVRRLGYKAVIK